MRRNRMYWLVVMVVLFGIVGTSLAGDGDVILSNKTLWKVRIVRETEEVQLPSGEMGHYILKYKAGDHRQRILGALPKGKYMLAAEEITPMPVKMRRIPAETGDDWMKTEFNDSGWVRTAGPLLDKTRGVLWKLILMRARFQVDQPADMKLSLTYKGGVRVYLNGELLTSKDLADGETGLYANAVPDEKAAFIDAKGKLRHVRHTSRTPAALVKLRTRSLSDLTIPAARLKQGVNVLAVSIHRSPVRWEFYASKIGSPICAYDKRSHAKWTRAALHDISLSGAGAKPNISAPTAGKLTAWNQDTTRKVYVSDFGDPSESLQPVRICGTRNGTFAGQVVLGGPKTIRGLKAEVSDLSGPGTIAASAVRLRYGRPDGARGRKAPVSRTPFDTLADAPPAIIEAHAGGSGAVQPVWITVKVPADAKAGEYQGTISFTAAGEQPVRVPLRLTVAAWTMPDYRTFAAYTDMFQSPETLAMIYNVPMWSEKHWELIGKSFELMGPMATKSVYLTCIRRTHLGNEHAIVRWKKGPDGTLSPDMSLAEKYLDLAVKHMGPIPTVVLYAWEAPKSMGHGNTFSPPPGWVHDREILITVIAPDGTLSKEKGPTWGTAKSVAFWRKLISATQKILDKHKMSKSLLFGLMGDHRPTKVAMDDVAKAAPNLKWAIHAHHYCDKWHGYEIGLSCAVWGIKTKLADPDVGRGYGWKNEFRLLKYPRGLLNSRSSLANYRTVEEKEIGGMIWNARIWPKAKGARGLGRQGADFWVVLKDRRGRPRNRLAARYPESYWGQLCINYGNPAFFGKGPDGALPTARSEMIRENVQEIEARVFIEKALLDKDKKALLGDDLAVRCRTVLDERIRMCLYGQGEGNLWFLSSGVTDRMRKLFALAAEVAKALGAK